MQANSLFCTYLYVNILDSKQEDRIFWTEFNQACPEFHLLLHCTPMTIVAVLTNYLIFTIISGNRLDVLILSGIAMMRHQHILSILSLHNSWQTAWLSSISAYEHLNSQINYFHGHEHAFHFFQFITTVSACIKYTHSMKTVTTVYLRLFPSTILSIPSLKSPG